MDIKFAPIDKQMSNGMRMAGFRPLSEEEIEIVKAEIRRIEADEAVFVFNDTDYLKTCYQPEDDKIYIGRNVFPDVEHGSVHPRDLMSIAAVLAHEYYGHRPHREEYLYDDMAGTTTTSEWEDECRASIEAAKLAPGLEHIERYQLIQDANMRAHEYGTVIQNDEFMKEVLYGYGKSEKRIVPEITPLVFIREESLRRNEDLRQSPYCVPEMRRNLDDNYER